MSSNGLLRRLFRSRRRGGGFFVRFACVALVLVGTGVLARGVERTLAQEPEIAPAVAPMYVPLNGIQAVATGAYYACALTSAGNVKCWGADQFGQLGNGAPNEDHSLPVDVVRLPADGIAAISAGSYQTCALSTSGGVFCWGWDQFGQLGDSVTRANQSSAVPVVGLDSGVTAISAGKAHTCALMSIGTVKCWGWDAYGQVGNDATLADQPTPVDVSGLTDVIAISSGGPFSCALKTDGHVWCWGANELGQLGNGTTTIREAVPMESNADAVGQLSSGFNHSCVVSTSNTVRCWGGGALGQLGTGANPAYLASPAQVTALGSGIQMVNVGQRFSCALSLGGSVRCFGSDEYGKLGNGEPAADVNLPVQLPALAAGVQSIDLGYVHGCALMLGGTVTCWGRNDRGQAGDGSMNDNKFVPVAVLVPANCFQLTLLQAGGGAAPEALTKRSEGCPLEHYLPGEQIALRAAPDANQRVQGWSPPVAANVGDVVAALTMPAAGTTVTVTYDACLELTRAHTGAGSDPLASPANSPGCALGRYGSGETILLSALPNEGQRVKTWVGTTVAGVGSQRRHKER